MEIKGIDVSVFQGTIDWDKVKAAGYGFAMIRATYGSTAVDKCFVKNVEGAAAAGVETGAYHYSIAKTVAAAEKEAEFFLKTIDGYRLTYPVALDMEDTSQQSLGKTLLTDISVAFLNAVERAGYFAMIYANKNWFENILDDSRLYPYAHWLAQWASKITYSGSVGMWQHSSTGKVSGIDTDVDLDISYNDYAKIISEAGLNRLSSVSDDDTDNEIASLQKLVKDLQEANASLTEENNTLKSRLESIRQLAELK